MTPRTSRDFQGLRLLVDDWPILVIDFPETRIPDAALADCLAALEVLLRGAAERREMTFTITDLTRVYEFPPATQRKQAVDWTARTRPLQKSASLGGAMVARSSMLRAFINAVLTVAPPALPSVFVATRRDAFAKAVAAYDAARFPLRPELRASLTKK